MQKIMSFMFKKAITFAFAFSIAVNVSYAEVIVGDDA